MESNPIGAGMGTSGLVGQFAVWATMEGTIPTWILLTEILMMHFILPALLTLLISEFMRKKGWLKYGDMELQL
jgi:uncharacterized membrane protein